MDPLTLSPSEFEVLVQKHLETAGGLLSDFQVTLLEEVPGEAGDYTIDVVARFTALGGAEFLVLIECKRHKNSIKRELVQVLHDKMQDTHAQKGMMFSTAPYQDGALQYAKTRRIALVELREGGSSWHTKDFGSETLPPPWIQLQPVELWHIRLADAGSESHTMVRSDHTLVDIVFEPS